jgi:hypothetical protein
VCVVHVSPNGDDFADGGSWESAKARVDMGIKTAHARVVEGISETCEVWVQAGTYVPDTGDGRNATLVLRPNVHVYGGFSGHELSRDLRDWEAGVTTLSGDVAGDDVEEDLVNQRSDNLYHVVTGADEALLDGFTIRGGHASDPGASADGGGLYAPAASPTLRNVTFRDNWAASRGGGLFTAGSSPVVRNCKFESNSSGESGGGMYSMAGCPTVTSCSFHWGLELMF